METTEQNQKPVKLTKSGKPDGRSISSKKNLEKGKKKVMDILQKAKSSSVRSPTVGEDDGTDDEEFEIKPIKKEPHKPVIETPISMEVVPLPLQVQEVSLPIQTTPDPNQFYIDEIELTKKELQEFKKQVQENNLREERRKQLEIQKQVDKIRMEAYGRLNSLSQNMSMKF